VGIAAWAELSDLPADRPALPGGDAEWELYLAAASETLYGLTGRRWSGIRERAIELYAPPRCGDDPCRACRPVAVRLPNRPVVELLAVRTLDGEALFVDSYRIARGGYLESAPGAGARLPTCSSPLHLRYRFGREPSDAGRLHAAHLADALGRARLDPDSSPLPGTITQIVRQGVTFTQQAASTLIEKGMTGLAPVDLWIATVNPTRSTRRPRAWSPDTEGRHYSIALTEVPL
jgi:hypothetical protein